MGMKKLLCLLVAVLSLGVVPASLTSCHRDDPEIDDLEKKKQEMADLLLKQKAALDLSEMVAGEKNIGMWFLMPDNSFVYFHIGGLEEGTGVENWTIDTLSGTWNAFADEENTWGGEGNLSGFSATFNLDGKFGSECIIPTMNYYFVAEEDSIALVLSEGAVEYAQMNGYDEEEMEAKTAALSAPATRSFWDILVDAFTTVGKALVKANDDIITWFANTFGTDQSSYNLNESDSKKFEEYANGKITELQKGSQTNYSEWMGQIYKGKENTRLCEMNIPGTHDTFTYYMTGVGLTDATIGLYARTQARSIEGQWNAGVRCFDVRLRSMDSEWLDDPSKLYDPTWWFKPNKTQILGMYHNTIFCAITSRTGINEIVKMLKAHPTETAILFCAFEGESGAAEYKMAKELMDEFSSYIVQNPAPGMTLKDCAGKMVVFQSWDRANTYSSSTIGPFTGTGYDTFNDHGYIQFYNLSGQPTTRLLCQNRYQASTTDRCTAFWNEKRDLMTQCFKAASATKGSSDNVWSQNQASAYVGGQWIHMSYSKNANTMNPWTFNYVYDHKTEKLGIITMDFAGATEEFDGYYTNGGELPKIIVESNRYQ